MSLLVPEVLATAVLEYQVVRWRIVVLIRAIVLPGVVVAYCRSTTLQVLQYQYQLISKHIRKTYYRYRDTHIL